MKVFSKVVACAFVLALAVVLAGCSSGAASGSASSSASGSETSASASAETSSQAASPDASASPAAAQHLAPGEYEATFTTDSSMFHVNEALDNKGTLTVTDEGMTIHVSLAGKGILNLYAGKAADAESDPDNLLQPTTDTVKYEDGTTDEVYGFDIPVPALDEEFDVALIGEKGKWYDHKVKVTDPVAL